MGHGVKLQPLCSQIGNRNFQTKRKENIANEGMPHIVVPVKSFSLDAICSAFQVKAFHFSLERPNKLHPGKKLLSLCVYISRIRSGLVIRTNLPLRSLSRSSHKTQFHESFVTDKCGKRYPSTRLQSLSFSRSFSLLSSHRPQFNAPPIPNMLHNAPPKALLTQFTDVAFAAVKSDVKSACS